MKKPIYLDYNATTPVDPEVANEMLPYLHSLFGNPSSSYSIGKTTREAINNARSKVAALINARPEEIIFTSCATESNNLAIQGFMLANMDKGKHIITSSVEHPSVKEVCKYLGGLGYEITYVPVDRHGKVNPGYVENAIRTDTALISIMHGNNEVGTIQPVREIAGIAKKYNITFHTDASQSVGKITTDVQELGVDLLTIAGHKLYAPKGIGALYIRHGVKIEGLIHGAGQEKRISPGTENIIHIVGLGKACEVALRDFDKNQQHMLETRDSLLKGLKSELGSRVTVNADLHNCLPNTLSIAFENVEAHALAAAISDDVFISTGSACHADSIEVSSVLKALNIDHKIATSTVRISTGKYTSAEDIDRAVNIISQVVKKLSKSI